MPRSFYAAVDLGGGLRGINSADPVNAQDAATKRYVDTRNSMRYPVGGAYWELPCQAQAANNSYTGAWANGPGLPPTTTITKLYASTTIRCKLFNVVSWATGGQGYQYWGVAIGGGSINQVTTMFFNRTGIRMAAPFGVIEFASGYFTTTGSMNVVWYISTSGCTWNVDTNDSFYGPMALISEVP